MQITEKEAIEELKHDCKELGKAIPCDTGWGVAINEAYRMAIEALTEIQQYRSIGTVSECRDAVEKQRAKKPIKHKDLYYKCPVCDNVLLYKFERNPKIGSMPFITIPYVRKDGAPICPKCGQNLDWERCEALICEECGGNGFPEEIGTE